MLEFSNSVLLLRSFDCLLLTAYCFEIYTHFSHCKLKCEERASSSVLTGAGEGPQGYNKALIFFLYLNSLFSGLSLEYHSLLAIMLTAFFCLTHFEFDFPMLISTRADFDTIRFVSLLVNINTKILVLSHLQIIGLLLLVLSVGSI